MTARFATLLPALLVGGILLLPGWVGEVRVSGESGEALAAVTAVPPEAAPPSPPGPELLALGERLRGEVEGTGWRNSRWGILAVSLERGDTLFAMNPGQGMVPASNLKLFTTAAALARLGPDFRFPTYLVAEGPIVDGVLEGNLVLYGTGDPSLGLEDPSRPEGAYATFLGALRELGVREIRGDVIGDGTFFEGDGRRPSWNPRYLNDWYAAPVSALSFNENVTTLRILAGGPAGAPPAVLTQPAGAGIPVVNRARTVNGRPGSGLFVVRDDPDLPVEIRGQIARDGRDVWRTLTVSDPPAYAASLLRETLQRAGVRVEGAARSVAGREASDGLLVAPAFRDGAPRRTIAVHRSAPLPELVSVVNRRSQNLYADLLLFTLGRVVEGEGSYDAGARVVSSFLAGDVGIPLEEFHIEDGSGLSPLNRASPASLVRVLSYMDASPWAEDFRLSLPGAGDRRELGRMYRTAAEGNLRAKTGTIQGVSALSGVVRTADGEPVLFSIVANNLASSGAAKRIEDRIGIQLAEFARALPQDGLEQDPVVPGEASHFGTSDPEQSARPVR